MKFLNGKHSVQGKRGFIRWFIETFFSVQSLFATQTGILNPEDSLCSRRTGNYWPSVVFEGTEHSEALAVTPGAKMSSMVPAFFLLRQKETVNTETSIYA